MIDITINITDYITIEQITNEFNKINNKREEYTLNLVLYKFVQPETLAVIVSLYKYKISEEYTISIIIKNGKSDGTTLFAQSNNPFLVAIKFDFENTTKQIANNIKKQGNIFFFSDININFINRFLLSNSYENVKKYITKI